MTVVVPASPAPTIEKIIVKQVAPVADTAPADVLAEPETVDVKVEEPKTEEIAKVEEVARVKPPEKKKRGEPKAQATEEPIKE